jgi:hypothetical protein
MAEAKQDLPQEEHELAARIQFIRVLNVFCQHNNLKWMVVGSFLRRLFGLAVIRGCRMDIALTPGSTLSFPFYVHVQRTLREMELTGYITKEKKLSPLVFECDVMMNIDSVVVSFMVIIDARASYPLTLAPQFSSDNLALTSDGLTVRECHMGSLVGNKVDRTNQNIGIGLLDRIIGLRNGTTHMCATYTNDNNNYAARLDNSRLMLRELEIREEGLAVQGGPLYTVLFSKSNEAATAPASGSSNYSECPTCPICIDHTTNTLATKLGCGHIFCIGCLAKHMSMKGDNHGLCPLCREPIALLVE